MEMWTCHIAKKLNSSESNSWTPIFCHFRRSSVPYSSRFSSLLSILSTNVFTSEVIFVHNINNWNAIITVTDRSENPFCEKNSLPLSYRVNFSYATYLRAAKMWYAGYEHNRNAVLHKRAGEFQCACTTAYLPPSPFFVLPPTLSSFLPQTLPPPPPTAPH